MDTKKLRQRILDLAIRGKLVPQDPTDEPASVLLDRIRSEKGRLIAEGKIKRPKAQKNASDTPHYPYKLPQGWEWCFIGDIAFVTKLAGFEYTNYIADNLSSSGVPLFKGKNIQNSEISYDFESYIPESISDELSRSQITKKCLLTPYVGTIGNIGIHNKKGKFHLGSNVGKIEILNSDCIYVYEEYIKLYLQSLVGYKQLTKTKKSTAQESISIEAIRSVLVPIPPTTEQERIIAKFEFIENFLHLIDYEVHNMGEKLNQAKSKILELAVTGKLVPQNPDDEPAAELLKRINPDAKIVTDNRHYPQLPANWLYVRLGDVVKVVNGKSQKDVENQSGEYPIYGSGGIIGYADSFSCLSGSTIIGRKGTINNPIFVETDFWNVDTAFGMKPYDGIIDRYFYVFCQSFDFTSLDKSSTLPSLTKSAIENIPFPLPPLEMQRRILSEIDRFNHLFSLIQEAI